MIPQILADNFSLKKDFGRQFLSSLGFSFHAVVWSLAVPLSRRGTYVGIDPGGTNLGIAVIKYNAVHLYQLKLPSHLDVIERIMYVQKAFDYTFQHIKHIQTACVEQAAYASPYGNVGLGEARTTLVIKLLEQKIPHILVTPPSSIRKEVFGHGKTKAQDYWKPLYAPVTPKGDNHIDDGWSALGCAFYAYLKEIGNGDAPALN